MYFRAVATDYDGTIAHHGSVKAETVAALKRCKESGRRLILVTGRELTASPQAPHAQVCRGRTR